MTTWESTRILIPLITGWALITHGVATLTAAPEVWYISLGALSIAAGYVLLVRNERRSR